LQLDIYTLNMKFKELESDGHIAPSITQYNRFDDLLGKHKINIILAQFLIQIKV
jgi:hypothetical protein